MSWQQVNLYLPELKPKVELLGAKRAAMILLGVCVLMLLQSLVSTFDNQRLEKAVAELELQQSEQRQAIDRISANLPRSQAAMVQQEVDKLRIELQRRQRIYQLINQQNLGNSDGFSAQLVALARQHDKAISLNGFELARGGKHFDFYGQARIAEALPQYLQRLKRESAFDTTTFGDLVIERTKAGYVEFRFGPSDAFGKVEH